MDVRENVDYIENDSMPKLCGYVEVIKYESSYILFNKINGCIVLFEAKHILKKLDTYYIYDAKDTELEYLKENQFFADELVIQKYISENLSLPTIQKKVDIVISVTEKCNLACKYCYQLDWEKCDSISDEEYISSIKQYLEKILPDMYTNHSTLSIYYIGGEPLLKSDLIVQITDMIQKMIGGRIPVRYNLDSNSVFLSREFILHFPNLQICTTLTPSDDHNNLRTFSYDSVSSKINEVKDLFDNKQYSLVIRYNVHHDNIRGIDTILDELEKMNFNWKFETQNVTNTPNAVFYNELSEEEYQQIYLDEIVPIMIRHGLNPQLLPEHTLSRHCRGISPFDIKFYSNGHVTLCDAFPKKDSQTDIPKLPPLPDMCIKCLDFPYCGGPKPCDKELCNGEYRYKGNAIERIKHYVKNMKREIK